MRRLRTVGSVAALLAGAVLGFASISYDDEGGDPPLPDFDETYLVRNLWDGQTSVPVTQTIELTVGTRDLQDQASLAFQHVTLTDETTGDDLALDADIRFDETTLWPVGWLQPGRDYVLRLEGLASYLQVRRWIPGDIRFSTHTAPRLVSLWRSDDTLMLLFSEPMDPATLFLGHGSVDLLWTDADGALVSLAATANLGNFAWDTVDERFRLAPLDRSGTTWLKVSAAVESERGIALDGDEDGIGGSAEDDVVLALDPAALPTCSTRVDIPDPCVDEDLVPEFF